MKDDAMDCGTKLLCYCALRHHLRVTGQTRKLQTQNAIFIFSSSLISCQLYALHKLKKKQNIITRRTKKKGVTITAGCFYIVPRTDQQHLSHLNKHFVEWCTEIHFPQKRPIKSNSCPPRRDGRYGLNILSR